MLNISRTDWANVMRLYANINYIKNVAWIGLGKGQGHYY